MSAARRCLVDVRGGSPAGRTAAPQARPPRRVTRGESPRQGQEQQRTAIDWLHVSVVWGGTAQQLLDAIRIWFGLPILGEEAPGVFAFQSGMRMYAYQGGRTFEIGRLAYGGETQAGRWLVQLSGVGCGLVDSWWAVRTWCEEQEDVRITRVDLACDIEHGEFTVDDACRWHQAGLFNVGGRNPAVRTDGDWLEGLHGRTLYIGRRENGKMLRVYEKGKEQGDLSSDWVRFEVQLGNRDREIPFEVLTERDRFFAGAYPALEQLLDVAGERIKTQRDEGEITLAHAIECMKRSYGKLVDLVCGSGFPIAAFVEEVRVVGLPRRLQVPAVAAGELASLVQGALTREL